MAQTQTRVESIAENIMVLSGHTQRIGQIIATVNEIASQSNMLAMAAIKQLTVQSMTSVRQAGKAARTLNKLAKSVEQYRLSSRRTPCPSVPRFENN